MKKYKSNPILRFVRIMVPVFFIGLFFLFGANLIQKDQSFSEQENRMLATRPALSLDKLEDGRFSTEYETYVNDQFVFRNFWVRLKSQIDVWLGKRESNGVYLGKDDYLIQQFTKPDEENLNQTIEELQRFSRRYPELKQYALIAPTAENIYQDKLPNNAPVIDQNPYLDQLKGALSTSSIQTIDIRDAFLTSTEDLYYHTDHHWTTDGAYVAFQAAAPTMGIDTSSMTYTQSVVSNDFQGTLSSTSGFLPDKRDKIEVYQPSTQPTYVVNYVEEEEKTASIYDAEKLKTKDAYAVFLGGNHSVVDIQTTVRNGRKLLVLKDSYANSFVPFLLPYYEEIVMVDPRYYYDTMDDIVSLYEINEVLFLYNANTFFQDTSLKLVLNPQ